MSYWGHPRTNYTPFYSQNQIQYLQGFYRVLVDVRVLSDHQSLKSLKSHSEVTRVTISHSSDHQSLKSLWKRIKSSHKAAVADGFATATFLNTKQARTWSAFTLGSWYPQRISFSVRKWMASAVHAGINSAILKE